MINEQTLKIYEEIKKEHSELENKFEKVIHTFNKNLNYKAIEMKNLFLKAIKEMPIDKIDVTEIERYNTNLVLLKLIIPTDSGNVEYVYLRRTRVGFNSLGLHFKLDDTENNYVSLTRFILPEELEIIDKFISILFDIDTYRIDMTGFKKSIQNYTEKTKQIQGGDNANNNK